MKENNAHKIEILKDLKERHKNNSSVRETIEKKIELLKQKSVQKNAD